MHVIWLGIENSPEKTFQVRGQSSNHVIAQVRQISVQASRFTQDDEISDTLGPQRAHGENLACFPFAQPELG